MPTIETQTIEMTEMTEIFRITIIGEIVNFELFTFEMVCEYAKSLDTGYVPGNHKSTMTDDDDDLEVIVDD